MSATSSTSESQSPERRFLPNALIEHVPLPGSRREPMPGSRSVGPSNPDSVITLTVHVASPTAKADLDAAFLKASTAPVDARDYASHAEVKQTFGADAQALDAVEEFASHYHLTVVDRNPLAQTVDVRGKVGDISQAFRVKLVDYHHADGDYRSRTGDIFIPRQMLGVIDYVSGLDSRPRRRSGFHDRPLILAANGPAAAVGVPAGYYSGVELAQRYRFPHQAADGKRLDGAGQTVAVIELGGGYIQSDLDAYFQTIGVPSPQVIWVSVDGKTNQPTAGANTPDGEVMLDIEVLGAVVPAARQVVYFGDPRGPGLFNAIRAAVSDVQRAPKIISISWGWPESFENPAVHATMDTLLKKAALLGITVCVASGDHGSSDVDPSDPHFSSHLQVDSPSCYEASLACGGTQITAAGEQAWNEGNGWAGGGGVSVKTPKPAYQAGANVPASPENGFAGRGVPDVSASATNYFVRVRGQYQRSGGTSAVAPLWAGLIARLAQAKGRPLGCVNPILYANPGALTDITVGSNDIATSPPKHYPAAAGWDAATGLGTPIGDRILAAL